MPPYKGTIWLTREKSNDPRGDIISAWKSLPVRYRDHDGYFWFDGSYDGEDLLARYWIAGALQRFHTLPDDDSQCVRIRK